MKSLKILTTAAFLFSLTIFVNAQKGKIELLETGEFHGEEVTAKAGELWLGLFKTGNNFALLETVIGVEMVHDPIVDDNPNEKTGKAVKVFNRNEPVFLIKDAGFLPQKNIETVFSGEKGIDGKYKETFNFKKAVYELRVDNAANENEFLGKDSKLILTVNGKQQILRELPNGGNDAFWTLYWVGDLDSDGKLDFYINVTDHYNVSDKRLFLSSQAEAGQSVKEAAIFRTTGC